MYAILLTLAPNTVQNKEFVKLYEVARRPVQYNKINLVTANVSEKKTWLC